MQQEQILAGYGAEGTGDRGDEGRGNGEERSDKA